MATLPVLWAGQAVAEPTDKKAKALLKKGRALNKKGDFKQAIIVLMKAQATSRDPVIELETGVAYEGLRDPVRAMGIYETLIDDGGLEGEAKDRCQARFDALRAKLGKLTIDCDEDDAEVKVNGVEVGVTPLDEALWVEPGEIKIVVYAGSRKVKSFPEIAGGQDKTVAISFAKKRKKRSKRGRLRPVPRLADNQDPGDEGDDDDDDQPAKVAPPPQEGSFPPRFMGRRWTWVAAAGALVTGVVGMGVGLSAVTDYNTYKDPNTPSTDYPSLEDKITAKSTAANVMYGLTGALAVTAVVLYIVEGGQQRRTADSATPRRQLVIAPSATPQGGGLLLHTAF